MLCQWAERCDWQIGFTQDAVGRGAIEPSFYLIDIEAGFEIWQGGQGLVSTGFKVRVGGA